MKLTFLGTGTSVGVPMIGCHCATCRSNDPRDQRLRTGLLVEHAGQQLLVDVSTDFRQQALRAGLEKVDAVLITHCHADHVFGLDDLRPINFKHGAIPVYASATTWRDSGLRERDHVARFAARLLLHLRAQPRRRPCWRRTAAVDAARV